MTAPVIYYADGFDIYPARAELAVVYSAIPRLFSTSGGRFGGGAPGSDLNGGNTALTHSLPSSYVDAWYSKSYYWDGSNGTRAAAAITFQSEAGVESTLVFDSTNFNIKAYRGDGAVTLLGTSANNVWSANQWMRVETRFKLHDSAGVIEVWINNVQVLNLTGIDNKNSSTGTGISVVHWPGRENVARWAGWFDDIAVSDQRLGDLRISRVVPTSDAAPNQGTPSTGTDHYAVVDEAQYNTSDYLDIANTLGQEERFGVSSLPVNADLIYAVMPISVRQKTNAGNAAAYNLVRSGSYEALGDYAQLATSWQIKRDVIVNDPATGAAWTASAVASMKLGYRVA